MDMKRVGSAKAGIYLVIALVPLITAAGCNSGPAKAVKGQSSAVQESASAVNATGPDIDLNCVIEHIQNPPESFHYTFKAESENPWEEEANVTPQHIDGSFMNHSLPKPHQFEGTPQEAWSNLQAIGRMASLFAIVHNTSAVVNEGTDKVNGYDTVKYSIDTGRADATEQGLYKDVLGPGGFEKGTVWVTSQGCPVRIVLNEEMHSKDGSVAGKAHYEEAMVKK